MERAWDVFAAAMAKKKAQNGQMGGVNTAQKPPDITVGHEEGQKPCLNPKESKEEREQKEGKKKKKTRTLENSEEISQGKKRKYENGRFEGDQGMEEKNMSCDEELPLESKNTKKKKKKTRQDEAVTGLDNSLTHNENHKDTNGNALEGRTDTPSKFKWKTAIRRVLRAAPEEGMEIKKLQRKVLALYYAAEVNSSSPKAKDELICILHQKLSNKDKYDVEENRIKFRDVE